MGMGYENCSLRTRENLQEISRMAYGSGWFEGRSGGAGRMGIWKTADGQYRVIKFNTKIGDRLCGDSMADDPRMLESCNRLRQELVLIATSAGVDPKVMRQIRAKLGLPAEGGTDAGKLLDRSDVAAVVTLIGGDKVWEDALHGRDMKDYKSDAHSSFKSLSERDFKVPSNVSEAIRDDGSRLTAASVRSLLVNVRGVEVDSPLLRANKQEKASVLRGVFDTVFDNDFAVKFAKEMTRPDGGYDELSVTTRLKTSVRLFFASSVKPDGTVNQFDERTRGDLLAACRLEVGSGSLSAFEKRLGDAGVTFADCFARGGSVIFANEKAIAAFRSVLEALGEALSGGMLTKESCRERALLACENIAWALEQGVACCTNGPDRHQALEAVASRFLNAKSIQDNMANVCKATFRAEMREKTDIRFSDLARVATLAHGAEALRAARTEARDLVALHQLGDLLPADDVLLSSQTDPLSTAETLFDDNVGEEKLVRAQFVQYRLAMLKAVSGMLDAGRISRNDLGNGVLAELLTGSVRESLANCEDIRKLLKTAAYGALSTMTTFASDNLMPKADFATEFLVPSSGRLTADFMKTTVRKILERQFGKIVSQSGPIANEKGIADLFGESRKEFKAIMRDAIPYMSEADIRTVEEKGVDLFAVLGEGNETFRKNAPALHLLADLAGLAPQEEKPDTGDLISWAKDFLRQTAIDKVFPGRQFSKDDAKLYDFVRVQFRQDANAERIKSAYDGFLKLVDEMAMRIAGVGGDRDAGAMRSALITRISGIPSSTSRLVNALARLVEQGGQDALRRQWLQGYTSVAQLRQETAKLRRLVDGLEFKGQNPFAKGSTDKVLDAQSGIDVAGQLADGLVNPKQAKADAEKTLSRLQTRQSLIKAYVGEINQVDRQDPGGTSKELFVKRTMLRMLSCMQLKYLDSADKAHMLESHIRAALNEDGGLWKSVQDVRAALTRQGRKAIDCSDEDLKALVDLQLRSSKQIFDFCFRDADAKKFLFDGKKDIGEEEQQDFMSAAVMGFTYGDPVVSAAVKDMSLGRELKQKFDAFVSRIDNLWKGLEDPDQAKTMAWSESDRHVFRLLTEKDSDLALAADAQTIAKGLAPLRFWSREAFGGKTDSPDQNPRRVEEDFRPEMPDLSDLADVDKRIRDLYRMGADEDVFKTLQDVEDSSNRIGRARNLLLLFQSSMNTALKNLPNDVQMKRNPREAFFRFWKDLCDPEMLFKGLLGRAENGIDALFANRKVRNEGIFKKISEAMANGLNDATPETLRASLRHVFTDAAAGLLQRTAEGLKRTEASDVIMAFWCMADQALVAILDRMPGLPMDLKSEKEEKDFFKARTDKVAREQQKRDVQTKQEEAARLKKESVLNLGNTPNVGIWPEQGDCQFLKLGAEKLGDTVKVDVHVAKLLLGSKEHVLDVRVNGRVLVFKPAGANVPADWSALFGKDPAQLPKNTLEFFSEYGKLASLRPNLHEFVSEDEGENAKTDFETFAKRSSMPTTLKEIFGTFDRLARPLIAQVKDQDRKRLVAIIETALKDLKLIADERFASMTAASFKQNVDGIFRKVEPKEGDPDRDLFLGVKALLDHALDMMTPFCKPQEVVGDDSSVDVEVDEKEVAEVKVEERQNSEGEDEDDEVLEI